MSELDSTAFSEQGITMRLATLMTTTGLTGGSLMTPLRYAITGRPSGPGMAAIMAVLGKEETLRRLETVITAENQPT